MNDERIINFFRWIYSMKFEAGICYYEQEFQVNITSGGHLICSSSGKTPYEALDDAIFHMRKVGLV